MRTNRFQQVVFSPGGPLDGHGGNGFTINLGLDMQGDGPRIFILDLVAPGALGSKVFWGKGSNNPFLLPLRDMFRGAPTLASHEDGQIMFIPLFRGPLDREAFRSFFLSVPRLVCKPKVIASSGTVEYGLLAVWSASTLRK